MQQPKKRPDTPLAPTPDADFLIKRGSELRAKKKAENKFKDNQKKIIIKEAGDRIKSDASKYI
jgi:hypothetical protein